MIELIYTYPMLEETVPMKIHESAENYLETILVLKRSLGKVLSLIHI